MNFDFSGRHAVVAGGNSDIKLGIANAVAQVDRCAA